ncbi:hypothetical protein T459_27660 [Capsicum annuum]|uniref:Uncharacterized protein n=1 Tax=Capsicum annuum TaxID=4072 RepID=A0A2G2YEJ4_CAPAN|nr:hypothetical protein FXO37_17985 [Capsicum annuum]PHT68173.1 hypothetical protein T459_27660 [Capsicum annuum]
MDLTKKIKVCLKGGLMTPIDGGVSPLNVQMRKDLDLENTESQYAGIEHEVVPGVVGSLKCLQKRMVGPSYDGVYPPHQLSSDSGDVSTYAGYIVLECKD